MADAPRPDVPLSRLAAEVVQTAYRELHALLDSLSEATDDDRRARMLQYVLRARHRLVRLLVAVRWHMDYSAFHGSASGARQLAMARAAAFAAGADSLWVVEQTARAAAAHASAVQPAAEILSDAKVFHRIPRLIEAAVGVDLDASSDDDGETEAKVRLSVVTRYAVREALPKGVVVLDWNVAPGNAAVRIGVPKVWEADVVLDRLSVKDAYLLLLRFAVHIASDIDTPDGARARRPRGSTVLPISPSQREPLRQMLEDRMRWSADAGGESRIRAVLQCLSAAMSFECCGQLAMGHVRTQATALAAHPLWRAAALTLHGVGSQASSTAPVRIEYWPKSPLRASVVISALQEEDKRDVSNTLRVSHEPPLSMTQREPSLTVTSINVEALLLNSGRARARDALLRLRAECAESLAPLLLHASVVSTGFACESLVIDFGCEGTALRLSMSLKTGGLSIETCGALRLGMSESPILAANAKRLLWNGERQFSKGMTDAHRLLCECIQTLQPLLKHCVEARKAYAVDGATLMVWPPGASSVETPSSKDNTVNIQPPLLAVERKRPKRFIILDSVAKAGSEGNVPTSLPPAKRARTMPLAFSTSSDGCVFMQGKEPLSLPKPHPKLVDGSQTSAHGMAEWAEIRHAIDIRLQRDQLLREFEHAGLATAIDCDYGLKSPHRTALNMKAAPLPVKHAFLLVHGDDGWEIQLTLTADLFDEEQSNSGVVSYLPATRLLTFSYHSVSIVSLKCFGRDIARARIAAALAQGLPKESKFYKLQRCTPSFTQLTACGLRVTLGYGKHGFQIETSPAHPVLRGHLIPLMEELLSATGRDMGATLADLLELSLPIGLALSVAVPEDPALSRIRFMTALQARIVVANPTRTVTCGIEVDGRNGRERVIVMDVGRMKSQAVAAAAANGEAQASSAGSFKHIPQWEAILSRLASSRTGHVIHGEAAVVVAIGSLDRLLRAIVMMVSRAPVPGTSRPT